MWQQSVFKVRHSINVPKVSSTLSLFLVVLGHTCQWTSLLAIPPLKVTVILVVVDRFSKSKLPSALQTAKLMFEHVFRVYGLPQDIVSDRGPQFTSRVWRAFCKLIGATASLTSGFHPQSNGQTERVNQELEASLRSLVAGKPSSLSSRLPWAEYAHNTLKSTSTAMSPFQCQFGFQPPLFPEEETDVSVPSALQFVRRC